MLIGKNIQKIIKGNQVLKGIDIEVRPRTVTALLGPSGSGKSTLLRALSCVDPPSHGEVTIDDEHFDFPSENGDRQYSHWPKVTVVFQQLFLWPHMTLKENIELPIKNHNSAKHFELAKELIEYFDLHDCVDRFPYQVSVGQRQRAAVIRALALRPKYLLLDEITSALDVEQVDKLSKCIREIIDYECGVLLVTHLIGFARAVAEFFVFIENGKVIESGSIDILNNPTHERVKKFVSFM